MKKALLALIGAGVVASMASLAFADGDAAYSANAVGVVKYTIPANGQLVCVSLPLTPIGDPRDDGSWTWGDTSLANQLDPGSVVYFWKDNGWQSYTKNAITNALYPNGWSKLANQRVIQQGEAFFLRGVTSVTNDVTISLLGQLPTEEEYDYDVTGYQYLDPRGPTVYPVNVTFIDTALAEQLDPGDSVYFWVDGGWQKATRLTTTNALYPNGWARTVNSRSLGVGEGMFVQHMPTNSTVIVHERPFAWDNNN